MAVQPFLKNGLPMVTCADGSTDVANGFVRPCTNRGGVAIVSKTEETVKPTQTPVTCKDGTTDFSLSSSIAKYDNSKVCKNNEGIAENQMAQPLSVNLSKEENLYQSLGLKSDMFYSFKSKGRLLVAVLLIAGYVAYKKFKK